MSGRVRGETPEAGSQGEGPRGLDVIRLDGRWAQVVSGAEPTATVRYLDDGSVEQSLDLSAFDLVRTLQTHVGMLEQQPGGGLSDEERARLHFGPEQRANPDVVNDIRVYGEYRRRGVGSGR